MTEKFEPQVNYQPDTPSESNIVPSANGSIMNGNSMQSINYVPKSSGWQIKANGNADFQDVTVNNIQAGGVIEITVESGDDLQTALDKINTQGGGVLRLSPGTYVVTNDLVIYDNTYIEGDSSGNTTVTFAGQAYGFTYTGTDVYTTGTLTANQGSAAVVGSGTTWTSAMIGRQIFISNRWYVIVAVTDTTHLTMATAFADANVAGESYRIANPINNVGIRNLTITGSTTNAIEGLDIRDMQIYDVVCVSNGVGISLTNFMNILPELNTNAANTSHGTVLTNGSFLNANAFANVSNGGSGAVLNNIKSCTFVWSAANANTADGYNLTDTDSCQFKVELSGNGGQGMEMVSGCDSNFINDSLVSGNTSDGIKLTATSDNNTMGASLNITGNGGYGINIAASSCDNNGILMPYFTGNTSGAYLDSGTGTDIVTREIATSGAGSAGWFGNGKDGIVTISSNTTLTTDKYYNDLTVNSGISLNTGGYRVFVKGTLTNNGTIHRNGNDGGAGASGAAGGAGGTAGAALADGYLSGSVIGAVGGAGSASGNGNPGLAGTNITGAVGVDGSAGGAGGDNNASGAGNTGGAAGAAGTVTAATTAPYDAVSATAMVDYPTATTLKKYTSSASSGGGGGGAATISSDTAGGGGGGASAGGVAVVAAKTIINSASGTISANGGAGGAGGNGSNGDVSTDAAAGGGGGGGGAGGILVVIYNSLTNNGTIEAAGGAGGAKGSAGSCSPGRCASDGAVGPDGSTGTLIQISV